MKALSIKQPWAWLIVNGHKDLENRTWWSGFRGPVLIHAGKALDEDFDPACLMRGELTHYLRANIDRGGIVGIAEITDCVTISDSRWFNGPYGLVIRNARPLPFHPCRGQLGFFEVDYNLDVRRAEV